MIYRAFFRLVLQHVDPERAHAIAAASLRMLGRVPGALALLARLLAPRREALRLRAFGLEFAGPLGVAAGVDKNATWFEPLLALGFGAVEVGTVTARAQPGNPRPRVTRLPARRALLNAMGFPNDGAAAVAPRLAAPRPVPGVVGVNVGKSKAAALEEAAADYRASVRLLAPAADYLVLNVSSPNTPGLREMQAAERLAELVDGVRAELAAAGRPELPLLVKLAPDLADAELERIADLAVERRLAGIVATNTTVDLDLVPGAAEAPHAGGISGEPLRPRALAVLRLLHARVGDRITLVAAGGIATPEDAWERILAGATLVQAYTGFVYGGPLWPRRVNRGLERLLRESPWSSVTEAVGKGAAAPPPQRARS